ncbi:zinc finger protein [Elysia marginata]|uniref:Zinc finger protein n=1 Tax=Elysia marginata TaxID=1093978 RepID=A0AAV4J3G4_9GAST|nr:zinc finger protein [Elysia marginata]
MSHFLEIRNSVDFTLQTNCAHPEHEQALSSHLSDELPLFSHPLTVSAVDPTALSSEDPKLSEVFSCLFCDHVTAGESNMSLHMAEVHKCRSLFFCTECEYQSSVKELFAIHVTSHLWVTCEVVIGKQGDRNQLGQKILKQESPEDTDIIQCNAEINDIVSPDKIKTCRKKPEISECAERKEKEARVIAVNSTDVSHFDRLNDCSLKPIDSDLYEDHLPNVKKPKVKFKTFSALMKTLKRSPEVITGVSQSSFPDCKKFTCSVCGYVTKYFENFKCHFMLHFDLTPFVCKHCNAAFVNQRRLKVHMRNVHAQVRSFHCLSCSYTAKSSECLKKHQRLMHPRDEDLKHQCQYCHLKFASAQQLHNHWNVAHKQGKKYVCDMCNFSSTFRSTLKTHINKHLGKTYLCSVCGHEFYSMETLKRHQVTHNKVARFQCDRCPFSTNHYRSLKVHSRIHTNERPFKCTICSYQAKSSSAVRTHMKSHMNIRKFSCNMCDKSFKFKHHLTRHQEKHASMALACHLCDYVGPTTASYQRHILLHDSKRRQNCSLCERYFATPGELTHHLRRVHGISDT